MWSDVAKNSTGTTEAPAAGETEGRRGKRGGEGRCRRRTRSRERARCAPDGLTLKRRRSLIEQSELAGPNHCLDPGSNAEHLIGLLKVLLDGSLRNPQDLADVPCALAGFGPA